MVENWPGGAINSNKSPSHLTALVFIFSKSKGEIQMKKYLILLLTVLFTMSMLFMGISCKAEGAVEEVEEAAPEEEVEEAAPEEEVEEAAPEEEIVITMWDWQGGAEIHPVYEKIAENFNKDYPNVRIEHKSKVWGAYETELKTALATGTAPDIFGVYPGTGVANAANEGSLVNLSPYVLEDKEWLEWMGNAVNFPEIYHEGGMYVVAQDRICEGVWYWKDMAEEAGITDAPVTIDDLAALVPLAEAAGMNLMKAGFNEGVWLYIDTVSNFVNQQQKPGENLIQDCMDGKISWQNPKLIKAINAVASLWEKGIFTDDVFSFNYEIDTMSGWYNREAIFGWIFGNWAIPPVPDEFRDQVGLLHFPLLDDSLLPTYNIGVGTDAGVYADSENIDLAVAFLKETYSPRSTELFINNGTTPPAELTEVPQTGDPVFDGWLKIMKEAPNYGTFYYTDPELYDALGNAVGRVALGKATTEEVLAELDAMME